ncbi:tetratricopeptide repeat protein [uncultured Gilliamella sp.]|uniref:tetratricopeptide repeat protein n=1 Tax=uncultured Gilliamella sp. TaxID=1193505 RepID=UPI0025EC3925|nr:tetratricopeptide repeat protein [uncultured Gilliamella sp.]
MPLLVVISTVIALFFAVHAVKNGQDRIWLYILFLFPILGSVVYFFAIYLSDIRATHVGYQFESKLRKAFDPQRSLREAQKNYDLSPTVDAKLSLAKALVDSNRASEALPFYEEALTGIYQTAPDILLQYANALYEDKQFNKAKQQLDYLREKNPNYNSEEGHLLYTKILVALDDKQQANQEFDALIGYYPSLEAISYYLQTLINWNEIDQARAILQTIEQRLRHMPKHSKRINSQWIKEIEQSKQKLSHLN